MTVCAFATSPDPTMFTPVMTMMISAAKNLVHAWFPSANVEVA